MATTAKVTSENAQAPAEKFFKYFQHEVTALQEQMERLGDTALVGGERRDATDHCLAGITRLSTEVKDASATIPPYDLRTYTEAIKALQDKLAETQAQHVPKQKFSFKTRKNDSAISLHEAAQLAAERQKSILNFSAGSGASSFAPTPNQPLTPTSETPPDASLLVPGTESEVARQYSQTLSIDDSAAPDEQQAGLTVTSTTTSVSSQSNAYIILPASASRANAPCTLTNLTTCCVDLSLPTVQTSPFASLTITKIQSSLLLCGSIAGPAHITGVKNSTLVISCRQFRMHECENVDIYLYCTSRPIIEDCKGLRFAETPQFYTDLLHSARPNSNQTIGTNTWEHVDDFKWLRSEQSPNWIIMPTGQHLPEKVWKEIIPGQPGMSVDEVLGIVNIKR